jgi:hypothetical protein
VFVLTDLHQQRLMKALEMNYRAKGVWECMHSGGSSGAKDGLTWTRDGKSIGLWFPRMKSSQADSQLAAFLQQERRRRVLVDVNVSLGPECTPRSIVGNLISFGFGVPQGGGLPAMATSLQNPASKAPTRR